MCRRYRFASSFRACWHSSIADKVLRIKWYLSQGRLEGCLSEKEQRSKREPGDEKDAENVIAKKREKQQGTTDQPANLRTDAEMQAEEETTNTKKKNEEDGKTAEDGKESDCSGAKGKAWSAYRVGRSEKIPPF